MLLLKEAREIGISAEDIRAFLRSSAKQTQPKKETGRPEP
ncbi:DNA-binding anti-repressor SinI [Weizmannia acidilactici]